MQGAQHSRIVGFIWKIADDVLRDVFVRGKYRDVILPMTVIRRLDSLLEPTKDAVLERKAWADENGVTDPGPMLESVAGQNFYNTSPYTLKSLLNFPGQLKPNMISYLDGFSPNVAEVLTRFKFRNQLDDLDASHQLGPLIERFVSPTINLSPEPVDGHPGLDNHDMGMVFEELIRRFNEENNEEAGEHFTPRDVVTLMADLVFEPVRDRIESTTYRIYDGAAGTGGMLTVGEERLKELAAAIGRHPSIYVYGQEINPETWAIAQADLLIKGESAENIKWGSTLASDAFPTETFDFMLSNPPYGKAWKSDLDRLGGKGGVQDPRFVISHGGDPEYSLITRSSDGQLMFLANKLAKMKETTPLGSRIAEVHNGSSLFTGDAGSGESNIRRWVIENDWLEAIIALPNNMFYNTGIATYVWILSNRKSAHRQGKVQLIDATKQFTPRRKNLGSKNADLSPDDRQKIVDTFLAFEETETSKIFPNAAFGYWKVTVDRPLRLQVEFSADAIARLRESGVDTDLATVAEDIAAAFGAGPHLDYPSVLETVKRQVQGKWTARREKVFREYFCRRNEEASPLVAKYIRRLDDWPVDGVVEPWDVGELDGTDRVPGAGISSYPLPLGAIGEPPFPVLVRFEPDPDLRDTEQVGMLESGGIEGFFQREVLPHVPDAWLDESSVKVGYEISFTRYFYKPQQLRTLPEIEADIRALEAETDGLLDQIMVKVET